MRSRFNLVFLFCSIVLGAGVLIALAQNFPAEFGVNEIQVKQRLVSALVNGGTPVYPDRKLFKAASPAAQAAFVKNTMAWIRAYTESAAFKADYAKQRESAKPMPPKSKGTPDEQWAKFLSDQRKSVADTKANVAKMSPDMQKQMAPMIKQLEENAEKSAKDPQMMAMMKQNFAMVEVSEKKEYADRMAKYEKKYPVDPRVMIAARLHEFLNLSKDVAFDAKLVPSGGGRMKFADAQYESKPGDWKMCYRIGKEPVMAARAFATEWLKQIEK